MTQLPPPKALISPRDKPKKPVGTKAKKPSQPTFAPIVHKRTGTGMTSTSNVASQRRSNMGSSTNMMPKTQSGYLHAYYKSQHTRDFQSRTLVQSPPSVNTPRIQSRIEATKTKKKKTVVKKDPMNVSFKSQKSGAQRSSVQSRKNSVAGRSIGNSQDFYHQLQNELLRVQTDLNKVKRLPSPRKKLN